MSTAEADGGWLAAYALELLAHAPSSTSPPSTTASAEPINPLGLLLLLLDCITFIDALPPSPSPTGAVSFGRSAEASGSLTDSRRAERSSSSASADAIDEFVAYAAEVYFQAPTSDCRWQSPLFVGSASDSLVDGLCATGAEHKGPARERLAQTAAKALDSLTSSGDPPQQLRSIIHSHSFLPPPLGPSLSATIASTLCAARLRAAQLAERSAPTLTFRWTLATILAHYFPNQFGQQTTNGVTTYARDAAVDDAVKNYHVAVRHLRSPSSPQEEEEVESEADRANGIRSALLSIDRRDEKMRWLLGDNFQSRKQRAQPLAPPSPTSQEILVDPPARDPLEFDSPSRKSRPASMTSFETFGGSHSRHWSAGSQSGAPLLAPPESPNRGLMHRRGVSVPGIRSDEPMFSPSVPFMNLDVAAPPKSPLDKRIAATNGGYTPASPTFTRSSPGASAPLVPRTTNVLSQETRRDLVKRSKKLEQMFGVPLEEAAAERVLVGCKPLDLEDPLMLSPSRRPGRGRRRSASFPPPSPTSTSFEEAQASNLLTPPAAAMSRSASSPNSASPSDEAFPPSAGVYCASRLAAVEPSPLQREERRRKLAKLQRLLGERVPADLISNEGRSRGPSPGGTTMGRSSSRLGGMLKGALGFGGNATTPKENGNLGGAHKEQGFVVVEPQPAKEDQQPKATPTPIKDLARARKLESMFGSLPPPSLYLVSPAGHSLLQDGDALGRVDSTASAARSLHSFRTSIASLQYLAEQDPGGLDELAKTYASSIRGSVTPSQSSEDEREPEQSDTPGPAELASDEEPRPVAERRSSANSTGHRRTVKKAQKLASFFGTTRGEVWGLLLDDLEAAIVEEDGLDEDERREVLGGVHKLRQTAV